ncbi:MAG: HDOD domain-containing protein [Gallionella sp.]|jgi:putative nucleotidyltransferase with HDIG domain
MKNNIAELLEGVNGLITLPHVFLRINQLIEDPDSTLFDIAKAISQDPSFTVRMLRLANSPFYGLSSTIATVDKAVSVIGTSQIRNLALSMSVASTFAGLPNNLVSMDNFWHHSLYCALVARILAKQARGCDPSTVFTAGLLHDIGELIIFNRLPEQARASLLLVLDQVDNLPVYQAERQVLGFDHAEVGGELARQWGLPPLLIECIACHHDIAKAQHYPRETALVHLADLIAQMAELYTLELTDVSPVDPAAWEATGLSTDIIEQVICEAQNEIIEAEKLFLGN